VAAVGVGAGGAGVRSGAGAGGTASGARPVAVGLLLCVGMLVIPLLALGTRGGAAARGTPVAGGRALSRPAGAPRLATASAADAAVPATLVEVRDTAQAAPSAPAFTTPLAAAAAAPVAAVTASARASLVAKRPATATPATPAALTKTVVPSKPIPPVQVVHLVHFHVASGTASWYFAPRPGICAHPTLPFGTILTLVDLATGRTATCTVDDRGPYAGGRMVDLAPDVFARLEPLGDGIAHVRIAW
jgi:rare lipoprotein A